MRPWHCQGFAELVATVVPVTGPRLRPRPPTAYDTVGVVVVTHTRAYLEDCLASIRAQTTEPDRVVVVDNASPASSTAAELAAVLGFETTRVDEPVSLAAARNRGIERLEGCDLVASLDGDDLMKPTYLEQYRAAARTHRAHVAFGPAELFGAETGIRFTTAERGPRPNLRRGNFVPANSVFTRDIWHRAGGFDPRIPVFEDWDFWLSCAEKGARFVAVDEPLWRYRRHPRSMLNSAVTADKDIARTRIWHKHIDFMRGPLQWRRVVRKFEKTRDRLQSEGAAQ